MKHLITLLFVLISAQLWAADNKQTYFCLSASDGSQKLLVLADVNGEQIGYLDTDEYKLNDENGILVGPSKEGSSFFKLASGKLDLMSSAGMWSGVCHQFTNENAQALSNASKSGEVAVSDSSASNNGSGSCNYTNPKNCTQVELCSKATYNNNGLIVWEHETGGRGKYVKEAKSRGLTCSVSTASSSNSSSSSSNEVDSVLSDNYYKFSSSERREIQKVLKSNGYYKGPIDGAWDKATKIALKKELNHAALMKSNWWVEKELKRILTAASSSSSEVKACATHPESCSKIQLCHKATYNDGSNKKFLSEKINLHSKLAQSRGLTCGVSHVNSSSSNSSSSASSCSKNPKSCKQSELCTKSTALMSGKKRWSNVSYKRIYVKEAKARGLSCGIKTASSSSSSSSSTSSIKIKKMTDGSLCWKARIFKNNTYHWRTTHTELKYVKEAKARGLTCGVISTNSSTPSGQTSSLSSADEILKDVFNSFNSNHKKNIQKYLKSRGYYSSSIDGKWGNKTKKGLMAELGYSSSMKNKVWVRRELQRMATIITSYSSNSSTSSASNLSNNALCEKASFFDGSKYQFYSSSRKEFVKEAKNRGLSCSVGTVVSSSSSSSSTSASNQKKKNWLLLGILGAAAIASGNGDAMATGFLQGMACGLSGNNAPCNNVVKRVHEIEIDEDHNENTNTSNLFQSGNNYKFRDGKIIGDNGSIYKVKGAKITASDGKVYKLKKNKIVGIGGSTTYKMRGDTLVGSDGARCKLRGNKLRCW